MEKNDKKSVRVEINQMKTDANYQDKFKKFESRYKQKL